MTDVILPRLSQTGSNEWADVEANDVALREVINGELDNGNLSGSAGITAANLAASAKPVTWYTPKVIATEETRTNVAFGTLTTADEIKEVVVPTNGLILMGYSAAWKSSVASAAEATIYLGTNQVINGNGGTAFAATNGTGLCRLVSSGRGLGSGLSSSADVTTGQLVAASEFGGLAAMFAAAGTYDLSVRFKASSGSVSAKERKLWVCVVGS